jgi:hypothetical protein
MSDQREHQDGQDASMGGAEERAATMASAEGGQGPTEESPEMREAEAAADHAGGVGAPVGVAAEGRARAREADDEGTSTA